MSRENRRATTGGRTLQRERATLRPRDRWGVPLTAWLLCASGATAQLAAPISDLPSPEIARSGSTAVVASRPDAVFFVTDEVAGEAVWVTDGTRSGTGALLSGSRVAVLAHDDDDLWLLRDGQLWWSNGRFGADAELRLLGDLGSQPAARLIGSSELLIGSRARERHVSRATRTTLRSVETPPTAGSRSFRMTATHVTFRDSDLNWWGSDGTDDGTVMVATLDQLDHSPAGRIGA